MRVHAVRSVNYYSDKDDGRDVKKYKFIANCTSRHCTNTTEYSTVVKPLANAKDFFCRDCGSALFTERVEVK